jgi:hypothetical protein
MHGAEHCERKASGASSVCFSAAVLPATGSTLSGTPKTTSARDRSLVTAFCSPVTAAPSRSLHLGVKAPGLLLRFLPHAMAARSDPRSTVASGLLRPRLLHGTNPVAAPAHGLSSCCAGLSPLRDCYFPRDQKQNRLGRYTIRPSESARFPFVSPLPLFPCPATGHCPRIATFSGACCSSEPLGTSFTMLPEALCVKRY